MLFYVAKWTENWIGGGRDVPCKIYGPGGNDRNENTTAALYVSGHLQ